MNDSHSNLTPGVKHIAIDNNQSSNYANERTRKTIISLIHEGSLQSALILSQQITFSLDSNEDDYIILARIYYLLGEFRRCITTLEQCNVLSISETDSILEWIDCIRFQSNNNSPGMKTSFESKMYESNQSGYDNNFIPMKLGLELDEKLVNGSRNLFKSGIIGKKLCAFKLAGQCLFKIEKYEDCVGLLNPFITVHDSTISINGNSSPGDVIESLQLSQLSQLKNADSNINPLACIYSLVGCCLDILENRIDAIKLLSFAVVLDPVCVEAVDHLINKKLISRNEKHNLYKKLCSLDGYHDTGLDNYYRHMLLNDMEVGQQEGKIIVSNMNSVHASIRQAELYYDDYRTEDAYRLSRQAYNMDPFDTRGLLIYIASATDLGLVSELYYIGHELTTNSPKSAISWYAVGCYYYCCKKYELAQKYIVKATKLDKRFINAWIALGHVLSLQEESEHAISSYRTAMRLTPGDHHALLFMAKELTKTNNYFMALNLLLNDSQRAVKDPQVLNEIGIILLKSDRLSDSLRYFHEAARQIQLKVNISLKSNSNSPNSGAQSISRARGCGVEIFMNYGFALRKAGNFTKSLECYEIALSLSPQDAEIHAAKGYAHHLVRMFDNAIYHYHSALGIRSNFSLVIELLQLALIDKETYRQSN